MYIEKEKKMTQKKNASETCCYVVFITKRTEQNGTWDECASPLL